VLLVSASGRRGEDRNLACSCPLSRPSPVGLPARFKSVNYRPLPSRSQVRHHLDLVEYLSSADERLRWGALGLPADSLGAENAIMLAHYNRYPLVIDPSGQAVDFLMAAHRDRKIVKTRSALTGGKGQACVNVSLFGSLCKSVALLPRRTKDRQWGRQR